MGIQIDNGNKNLLHYKKEIEKQNSRCRCVKLQISCLDI